MSLIQKLFKAVRIGTVKRFRFALLRNGTAAAIEHRYYLKGKSFDAILDVGANRGQFSLAARHWQPNAHIFAFEPQPSPADHYRRNFGKDTSVTLFEIAVMQERQQRIMHISRRDDSSSMLSISDAQKRQFPGTDEVGTRLVPCAPFEDILSKEQLRGNVLLKIDVQGAELEVLLAAKSILSLISSVYVELSFMQFYERQPLAHDVIEYLDDNGFSLTGVFNPHIDMETNRVVQADFAFEKRKAINHVP